MGLREGLRDADGLRAARESGPFPSRGAVLGAHLEDTAAERSGAFTAVACFGIRRASEVARLTASDVKVDPNAGALVLKVRRMKNDQYGLVKLSHFLEVRSWETACPSSILSGRIPGQPGDLAGVIPLTPPSSASPVHRSDWAWRRWGYAPRGKGPREDAAPPRGLYGSRDH